MATRTAFVKSKKKSQSSSMKVFTYKNHQSRVFAREKPGFDGLRRPLVVYAATPSAPRKKVFGGRAGYFSNPEPAFSQVSHCWSNAFEDFFHSLQNMAQGKADSGLATRQGTREGCDGIATRGDL